MKWLKEFYGVDDLSKPILMMYFKKLIKRKYGSQNNIPDAIYMRNKNVRFVDSTPEEYGIKLHAVWYDGVYHLYLEQDGIVYEIGFMEDPEPDHIDSKCVTPKRLCMVTMLNRDLILTKVANSSAMCHLSALNVNNVTCDYDCDACTFSNFTKLQEFMEDK